MKKRKKIFAAVMTIMMLLMMMPVTAFAEEVTQDLPEGFTTNGKMAYKVNEEIGYVDIRSFQHGQWINTAEELGWLIEAISGYTYSIEPSFYGDGKFVIVTIKVSTQEQEIKNDELTIDSCCLEYFNSEPTMVYDENEKVKYFQRENTDETDEKNPIVLRCYVDNKADLDMEQTGTRPVGIKFCWRINLEPYSSAEYKFMVGVGTEEELEKAAEGIPEKEPVIDYVNETITDLEAGDYSFAIEGETDTYKISVGEDQLIPIIGKDADGKEYDFTGKNLSIKKEGTEEEKKIQVGMRQDTPEKIASEDVTFDKETSTITLKKSFDSQEYILVPKDTALTEAIWANAKKGQSTDLVFDRDSEGNAIEYTKDYILYTRVPATADRFRSYPSEGSDVIACKIEPETGTTTQTEKKPENVEQKKTSDSSTSNAKTIKAAKTGDTADVWNYTTVLSISVLFLAGIVILRRKNS